MEPNRQDDMIQNGRQRGRVVRALDLNIRRSRVQIPFGPPADHDIVLGSAEFNFSSTLVNSQVVCLPPVRIFNLVMLIYHYLFILVLKSPNGEWPITYTFTHAYYACYYVPWHCYARRISAEFHRANEIHLKNFEKYENAEKSKKADIHLARVLKISRLCANFNRGNIFSVNDAAYPQWRTHQLSFHSFITRPLSRKKKHKSFPNP